MSKLCVNCGKDNTDRFGFQHCKKCEKELGITYPDLDYDCWSNACR